MNIFSLDFEGCSKGEVTTAVCQGLIECVNSDPVRVEKARQLVEATVKEMTAMSPEIHRQDVFWITMSVLFENYRRETGLTIQTRKLGGGPVH